MNTLFNAILYYSRLPIPFKIEYRADILSRALMYLPLVGLLVGAIGYGTFWVSSLVFAHQTSVLIAIAVMVLTTGAFHEDGFADFCDGFGGGYGKEAILRIMKDSHIGCYGVIGLIMVFMLRYSLLSSFEATDMAMVLIISQGASRFAPVLMVRTSKYARLEESKSSQSALGISNSGVFVAGVVGLLPAILFGWIFLSGYIIVISSVFLLFRTYIHRNIGGFTGDTLGALQIISELLFYLTLLTIKTLA